MFGGLDVKDKQKKEAEQQAAGVSPVSSAFSFLMGAPAPAPAAAEPPVPASSGFSFLNSTTASTTSTASEPEVPAVSGFSFLQPTVSKDSEKSEAEKGASSIGTGEVEAAPTPSAVSSFSFMTSPAASEKKEAATPDEAKTPPRPTQTSPVPPSSTGSGFSFLASSMESTTTTSAPPEPEKTTTSSASPSLKPTPPPPDDLLATVSSSQPPMGSGVVFGAAAPTVGAQPAGSGPVFGGAAVPKKVKKRRAQKVGVAANHMAATNTMTAGSTNIPIPPPSVPPPLSVEPPKIVDTASSESANKSTRDASLEASRRAEEFINQKLKEQEAEEKEKPPEPVKEPAPLIFEYSKNTEPEDEVLAAAQAAAKEAQALESARPKGTFMGGLFQRKVGWGASPPTSSDNLGQMKSSVSAATATAESLTPAERFQKQQEEIKRAMVEPHLGDDEDDSSAALGTEEPPVPEYGIQETPPHVQAPPKSPEDLFEDMVLEFSEHSEAAMAKVAQLRQQRSMLLEERFVTFAKERLATQQIAQAEAQQMAAAEAEDFDLADQMGTVIEAHTKEKSELVAILENIGRAVEELDSQKQGVVDEVVKCFAVFRERLTEFKKKQHTKESKEDTKAMQKFSTVAKQLSAENERLQQDSKHLERDEKLVAEEREELDTAISDQAGEFERLRDDAKVKLDEVEEEIEELLKQLAAKEAVRGSLREEVAAHEESIKKVRSKFSRQLVRVQKKETALKENRREWEHEKKVYEDQKVAHEQEVKEHSEALMVHEALMTRLKSELALAKTFELLVAQEIGFSPAEDDNDKCDGDLAQLQADVVKSEASVCDAKEVLKAANAAYDALETEYKTLIERIPGLESEKKAAVARRDFKAASKASKEIKDATVRLRECEGELTGEASERKNAAEEELKKLERDLDALRSVAQKKEKESGTDSMNLLAGRITQLVETKKKLCGNASGRCVQSVGALVLTGQIESLKKEGEALGHKYGGWDELMKEIAERETAETHEVDASEAMKAAEAYGVTPDFQRQDTGESELESKSDSADVSDGEVEVDEKPLFSESSRQERFEKCKELMKKISEAEKALNTAVENEDYDEAADLQDVFEKLSSDLNDLRMTDAEIEVVLAMGDESSDNSDGDAEANTEVSDDNVGKDEEDSTASGDADEPSAPEEPEVVSNDGQSATLETDSASAGNAEAEPKSADDISDDVSGDGVEVGTGGPSAESSVDDDDVLSSDGEGTDNDKKTSENGDVHEAQNGEFKSASEKTSSAPEETSAGDDSDSPNRCAISRDDDDSV